ncbi:MAG: hypothetical protein O6931_02955, partial [Gammaproteobacteria bacterium]|nr:hypothetical protein [Gammaproteobacteria bacterium]
KDANGVCDRNQESAKTQTLLLSKNKTAAAAAALKELIICGSAYMGSLARKPELIVVTLHKVNQ